MDRLMRKTKIRIPGSSGNIGPGFDTLALAYKIYLRLTFELDESLKDGPIIEVEGECQEGISKDESNLIIKLVKKNLKDRSDLIKNLKVTIDNDIPLARGLGSSSAASIGAVWGAQWLRDEELSKDGCIQVVSRREGHAENASASAIGGLVAVGKKENGEFQYVASSWPASWSCIVVVPEYEVSTPEARKILPRSVKMEQAVTNIQNTAMILSAVMSEDRELFKSFLRDTIHEPYRETLVPELTTLRAHLRNRNALGTVLSGAGPTILTIVEEKDKKDLLAEIESWKSKQNCGLKVYDLEVDEEGLVVEL